MKTVHRWWQRWPDANIGVAAGKSGLLVLDADSYKDNYEGARLLSLEDEQTVTNLTGSGGSHLVYLMPEGAFYTNARGTLPKGIDIRGWGGQFVVPPSVHPSGNRYIWEMGYGPHEIAPLPAPERLCNLLSNATAPVDITFGEQPEDKPDIAQWRVSRKIAELIYHPLPAGERSEADQAVITALVRKGASNDQIRAVFEYYPIGAEGKFATKGRNRLQYLARSIAHARDWYRERQQAEIEQRASNFIAMAAG